MHRQRGIGMSGPLPLSLSDMKAWADLTGERVRPDEWHTILSMDVAYLSAAYAKKPAEPKEPADESPVSNRPVSPGLVRALFGRKK